MSIPLVAVVGSTNLDLVFRCARLPSPGETLLGGSFTTHPGGKGGNQAVAIARLSGNVEFIGCTGADANSEVLRGSLSSAGVKTQFLATDANSESGTAGILVDEAGRNMIIVAPGANMSVNSAQVQTALDTLRPPVVLAQLEIPPEAVESAARSERFILNPAPARPLSDELLARCFAITPNETETELLTGIAPTDDASCLSAAAKLLDKGVQNVIITLGERGSFWASASGGRLIDPLAVNPVDTTAAGDAFNGALAWFVAEGRELANAIQLANCVGALATTKHGAQEAMPSLDELGSVARVWM